jgi:hypothetical protein
MLDKRSLLTLQQIDGTGIKTPHDRELKGIAGFVLTFLPAIDRESLGAAVEAMGGSVDELGIGEDYVISFEFFPGVRMHAAWFGPGDEPDSGDEAKCEFLFSGERAMLVSSEDLASLVDLTLEHLHDRLEAISHPSNSDVPSRLLATSLLTRTPGLDMISPDDLFYLAEFVGGSINENGDSWTVSREFFPGVVVAIEHGQDGISATVDGENHLFLNANARDQLAIFLVNHCLRFAGLGRGLKDAPEIVEKVFSFSYLRDHT